MKSELIVDVRKEEIEIALLEDGRLQEFSRDRLSQQYSVGDIYYGRVKKLLPALNAVFVDVGYHREAFLHYYDLGNDFRTMNHYVRQVVSNRKKFPDITDITPQPRTGKEGQIGDVLKVGDEVLVQIIKEPISTKGPRLSAEISFAGRYMVLLPFGNNVSVSTKIKKSSERSRLRQAIMRFKPEGFGVIVRTVAEDKTAEELSVEFDSLLDKWYETMRQLQRQSHIVPQLVSQEMDRALSIIRDVLNPSFDHIYINNLSCYQEIKDYVKVIAPERANIVEQYVDTTPIFDKFGVTRQLKSGMGRTVSCKNGAYLIIDHTEALHVIDVNSGTRNRNDADQEKNAYDVNIVAAEEIVHQLRLRDMGGIIVIDFIDMHTPEHKQQLYDYVRNLMENDRARHNVLPLSKFGLMQITRQRVRPVVDIEVKETCPTCHGTGKVDTSVFITDEIEQKIAFLSSILKHEIVLYVHPFVEAYISKGLFFSSLKWKWKRRYGSISVVPSERLGFLEYKFYDRGGTEINVASLQHQAEDDYVDELDEIEETNQPKAANDDNTSDGQQQPTAKKKKKKKKKKSSQTAATLNEDSNNTATVEQQPKESDAATQPTQSDAITQPIQPDAGQQQTAPADNSKQLQSAADVESADTQNNDNVKDAPKTVSPKRKRTTKKTKVSDSEEKPSEPIVEQSATIEEKVEPKKRATRRKNAVKKADSELSETKSEHLKATEATVTLADKGKEDAPKSSKRAAANKKKKEADAAEIISDVVKSEPAKPASKKSAAKSSNKKSSTKTKEVAAKATDEISQAANAEPATKKRSGAKTTSRKKTATTSNSDSVVTSKVSSSSKSDNATTDKEGSVANAPKRRRTAAKAKKQTTE